MDKPVLLIILFICQAVLRSKREVLTGNFLLAE